MSQPRFLASLSLALLVLTLGALSLFSAAEYNTQPPARENWPQATGDVGNSRYSALTQIDTGTVKNLGATWISDKFDDGAASRVTPVVNDGLMFVTAGSKVYAFDAKSGKIDWKLEVTAPGGGVDSGVNGGGAGIFLRLRGLPNTQGVATGEGKLFVALNDASMLAIDQKSGKIIWRKPVNDDLTESMRGAISASPVYADGVVYTCVAFNEGRHIGRALALDAKDGHQIWRWDSVPGPNEPGHETWTRDPNNITWKMGGADVWLPPVVDTDLGLVYYGTGNPSPNRVGDVRPGNNLYSCSIVALDVKTGKLRWYFQFAHHDLWESDLAQPMVGYETEIDGKPRKGLAFMRPDGTLFLLDRQTGKPLFPVEERPVRQSKLYSTSPTQPYPVGHGSFTERDCTQWKPVQGFIMRCEFFQPPSDDPPNVLSYAPTTRSEYLSYDQQTKLIYIEGIDRMQWEWNSPQPSTWEFNVSGYMTSRVPSIDRQAVMIFAAVDPKTYNVVWKKQFRMPSTVYGVGGWLTTAGGLAFHRLEDGNLVAYDAKTGDELWKFQTGVAGTSTASPMSYQVDGQQFVALVEDSNVWSFRLGGEIPQRPAPKLPALDDILEGRMQESQVIRAAVPDDYNYKHDISPLKDRVKAGSQVTFLNNGSEVYTFVSDDGFWTTGPLLPRQTAILTFEKPGTFLYHFKEYPFSYGLLEVDDAAPKAAAAAPAAAPRTIAARAGEAPSEAIVGDSARGKSLYDQQCSACHQSDLSGSEFIPALAGSPFAARWQGKAAKELFDRTRTTMPSTSPGSLGAQDYQDLILYILKSNGVSLQSSPAGERYQGTMFP